MKRIGIYAGKNLLRIILLLFAVSILTFALVSASPIDPLQANVGQAALGSMSEEQKEKLRSYWGVDEPPVQRYLNWLNAFIKGDGGISLLYRQPVTRVIAVKLGNSLFQINFRRCPLLRRYAFQWNYAFHNSSLAAFDPLDVRHSFNHLRHLFRLSSEYRTGDDIELHVAVVCRGLHSDDFPAPSRSSELGADGDGAFRFYRRRDHARTNHRTA